MEFTKLFKYASAILFLILLAHGLFLGFSIPTTIISIALLSVCFAMEQKLVKHEREEFNTKLEQILTMQEDKVSKLVSDHKFEMLEMTKKLDAVHSQLTTLKTGIGMRKV